MGTRKANKVQASTLTNFGVIALNNAYSSFIEAEQTYKEKRQNLKSLSDELLSGLTSRLTDKLFAKMPYIMRNNEKLINKLSEDMGVFPEDLIWESITAVEFTKVLRITNRGVIIKFSAVSSLSSGVSTYYKRGAIELSHSQIALSDEDWALQNEAYKNFIKENYG